MTNLSGMGLWFPSGFPKLCLVDSTWMLTAQSKVQQQRRLRWSSSSALSLQTHSLLLFSFVAGVGGPKGKEGRGG